MGKKDALRRKKKRFVADDLVPLGEASHVKNGLALSKDGSSVALLRLCIPHLMEKRRGLLDSVRCYSLLLVQKEELEVEDPRNTDADFEVIYLQRVTKIYL